MLLLYILSASSQAQTDTQPESGVYEQAEELFYLFLTDYQETICEQSLKKYQQAIESFKQQASINSVYADCYHKRGILYHIVGQPTNALEEYHQAVKIKKQLNNSVDTLFFKDLILIGNIHFQQSNFDSAKHYYTDAERILHRFKNLDERRRLYNSWGVYYDAIGNYQQAVSHYQKALTSLYKQEPDYEYDKALLQSNVAQAHLKLGNYDEALKILRLADEGGVSAFLSNNIGINYLNLQKYDSALCNLKKALERNRTEMPFELRSENYLSIFNNLGSVFLEIGIPDSADWYYRKSYELNRRTIQTKNAYLSASYIGLANVKLLQDSVTKALDNFQQAVISSVFDFNNTTTTKNPSLEQSAISLLYLFQALQGKAAAWHLYYQQDQDLAKLNHSLSTYQRAIRVAQHIQKTYDNDEAKLFLVNKVAPVYEEAIATAVQLHQLTDDPQYVAQAFQFSEASKAAVLTESLRDVEIKTSGEVDDSLVQDEHRIKQQITALRLKLVESQDSAQNEHYRQQLIDQEIALARTIEYLQKDEHYYQRKYQPDSLDIAALQKSLLSDNEVLLEYFVGQKEVYVFALRHDDLQVASVARTAELDSALRRIRRHLYDYRAGQGEDAVSLATLYRYLIAPVADAVVGARKLIVVPDGSLHYLPFDLLSVDGQRANYLLHTYTLHYGYSASLLQQAVNERRGYPTKSVLAMAPFTGGAAGNVRSQGFSPLRDSKAEVESVGGSIYTEGEATKRRFLRVAGSYNVLHLATHAAVNDEDPSQSFIAFYPQQRDSVANYRLYTHELYNMRLDSVKLVILSACETGNGQLVRGEGVMSLARAFAYAGCPNTITTLWKADDHSSAQLTTHLHHYLKQGWEKDEALRQAKLDYLNDPKVHPAQKAPYYWANFVFIGDPVAIYDNYQWWWWLAVGLLLLVVVGMWLWQRRNQRRPRQMA